MSLRKFNHGLFLMISLASLMTRSQAADLFLNEILFNPPGSDTNTEYVEIRGAPNDPIPDGTWFVSVEGDTNGNPGTIQNTIDLSRLTLGQNGFLVLLQQAHRYKVHPYCNAVANAGTADGWGHGSTSSIRHKGEGGQTEFENPSATFFLIQTATTPRIGDDIDADDDGNPDGPVHAGWTILDSVGVLDNDGASDTAYGRINFRRVSDTPPLLWPTGLVVSVPFTPGYVGRNGNSTGWTESDWVASDNLLGKPPKWKLGKNSRFATNTVPANRSGARLAHLGAPNFIKPALPFVLVREIGGDTQASKGGKPDRYLLSLTTKVPTGYVTIRAQAAPPLEISLDRKTYTHQLDIDLNSPKSGKIFVRVSDDNSAGPSLLHPTITHSIIATADPINYPESTLIQPVRVTVTDSSLVLLTEAKVNPPGTNDGPFEFVELLGPPGKTITNLYFLAVQGNTSSSPGRTDLAINLSGQRFGANGHLLLAAPSHPYQFGTNASVMTVPELDQSSGALDNGSLSLLLVGSWVPIAQRVDLDMDDNGTLERLPADAIIMDAVAWRDGDSNDILYGSVDITQRGFTPDAVSRVPGNLTPNAAEAWMAGNLVNTSGASLVFNSTHLSSNLPPGSVLTPGFVNATAPSISAMAPVSHVLGDEGNPSITFSVSDDETPVNNLLVSATSTNQLVVPDSNLFLDRGGRGEWTLRVNAIGVGYADIVISVSDGTYTGVGILHFAASAPGRPGGVWHTGISDASTAMPIDSQWMFIGDDENQTLRIYSRTQSGGPVAAINFSPFLGLVDFYDNGTPKEVDIEGSTRVGNRIFWLGSHSHSADTLERTNRARLFSTDVSGSGTNSQLTFVGRYDYLKLDLLAWDQNNRHGKGANYYGFADSAAVGVDPKAPDGSGFNMEGLCMAPGSSTEAYLAFRAPLIPTNRAKALILPVSNFTTLAAVGGPPGSAEFGPPIELNLGGRGIRSIEGNGTEYLIVAGPSGGGTNLPPPADFRLFTWTGRPNDVPQERTAELSELNIEGIVEIPNGGWTASTKFQFVTDGGTNVYYGDGIPAKRLPVREFKKFRTDVIELGEIAIPIPVIRSTALTEDGLRIEWLSREQTVYRLQMRATLNDPWTDYGSTITVTDAVTVVIVPLSEAQCFFRVVTVPDASP